MLHMSHAVLPSPLWCVPAAHGVQLSAPAVGPTVPAAQSVASAEPTGQKVPSAHVMHWSIDVITERAVSCREPPGHGSGAAVPVAQ